jgi:hypothetical protein
METVNTQSRTALHNVKRFIFKLDTPPNSSAVFKVGQSQKFELPVAGHEEAVFDVVP